MMNDKLKSQGVPAAKIFFPSEDRKEILEKFTGILDSGQLTLGKYTAEFEQKFAAYIGVKHAIAVNSGTSAIEVPMRIFGVAGKEVIIPTNTFAATAFAAVHAGGKPRFADVDPKTLNLSLDTVRKLVNDQTGAVISVHIGGMIDPYTERLRDFCAERKVSFFEDAAHAHGSHMSGKFAGTFGAAAAFSFYPTKVMTSGEGGMIVTNDDEIHRRALVFRDQGKAGFSNNLHTEMGYNWRLSEVHALLGLYQLKHLDEFVATRRRIAAIYDDGLKHIKGIQAIPIPKHVCSNYYKYVAILDKGIKRPEFKAALKQKYNVSCSGEVYELALHEQPVFSYLGYKKGDFPVAEDLCARQVCLPVSAVQTDEQARYVLSCLKEVLQ